MIDPHPPEAWLRPCHECAMFHRVGTEPIGTCAIGGPDPTQGCCDVRATETCGRWTRRDADSWARIERTAPISDRGYLEPTDERKGQRKRK